MVIYGFPDKDAFVVPLGFPDYNHHYITQ